MRRRSLPFDSVCVVQICLATNRTTRVQHIAVQFGIDIQSDTFVDWTVLLADTRCHSNHQNDTHFLFESKYTTNSCPPPLYSLIFLSFFVAQKFVLIYFCKPPSKLWRSAQTSTIFLAMTFVSLMVAIVALGYVLTQ